MQARALAQPGHLADPILDWPLMGYRDGQEMDVDIVVGAHDMVKLNGSVHRMAKCLSLVDDFFPTLQFPSKTEGDWILINSGLFRKRVFEEVGALLRLGRGGPRAAQPDARLRLFVLLFRAASFNQDRDAHLAHGGRGDRLPGRQAGWRDRNEVRSRTRTIPAKLRSS